MHIHILGICGTFMGSLAQLAKQLGHQVSGSDANVYPPMSTQLELAGIELIEGFDPQQLQPAPDLIVVGNAMSRGNPCVEYMLDNGLAYTSGPQWLGENVLRDQYVISVSGTHGKTTTSSMVAAILEYAGLKPGFLIGGVPLDFGLSARLSAGSDGCFVVEADEYDSAFFDKRSKFVHYHSNTLVMNNLEFDHGDIFDDLAEIQRQFHHLVRTLPSTGQLIYPADDSNLQQVVDQGCWSHIQTFALERANETGDQTVAVKGFGWRYKLLAADGSRFEIIDKSGQRALVSWQHSGRHNVLNAIAAVMAASTVGVNLEKSCEALCQFVGVKRRMEIIYEDDRITVYDDFAHHPTAIISTVQGLRAKVGSEQVIAIVEPRSATMKLGMHKAALSDAVAAADCALWYKGPAINWDLQAVAKACTVPAIVCEQVDQLLASTLEQIHGGAGKSHVVVMSNGGFEGFHLRLVAALKAGK
ncbi:UDP-N-acetylmuramate:L-alanyl-gamma-D-glutamyl-meso-diaminopimelate ligase [SAR92 clade bacterium H455]|uniref:UDP-N-acetylmuramate--L-alanyl-gamma-D-glutamyl-meso-2,6-diaminoheptandioate ligase n=1 Tax=SAR92 clade bacterium H455 TaxID=2974818 RepID=A0ABY5TQG4_9GAMM|nr:UDP-N-acetylmuramate:L-alanyl-gamma-D-glutamyl-meso-diaminopimelate ligase [SAR92 clade bacterium H455]